MIKDNLIEDLFESKKEEFKRKLKIFKGKYNV